MRQWHVVVVWIVYFKRSGHARMVQVDGGLARHDMGKIGAKA